MNKKFISDSNFVLKQVLNQEENLDILKDFIEGILKIEIDKISFQKKVQSEMLFKENMGIANVKVITKEDEKINIGIQIIDGYYIQHKVVLYYAQIHSNQALYDDILKTITINIIDDEFFKAQDYCRISQVKDPDSNILKNINLGEMHILQLPKFKVQKIDTKEKAWVQYLKNGKICEKYEKIKKLDNMLDKYWKDEVI